MLIVFIVILAIILSLITVYLVNKNPNLKIIFQVVYGIAIIVLAIMVFQTIMEPINFDKERAKRENATIERLKEIRTVQEAYKDKFGKYTGSFDTLISFVKADSFNLERIVEVQKWDQDAISRSDALKQGILQRTVIKKSVRDSLFTPDYIVDNLRYIPFTNNKEFTMAAGEVETGSQVKVKVFEAYAMYDDLFHGMDRQEVVNYKYDRYQITDFEGVKVGSLTEANNNAGNWEK